MLHCASLSKSSFLKSFSMLVLVGWGLVSCRTAQTPPNIFVNAVCEPPCWENIIPGVTTEEEASTILTKFGAEQTKVDVLTGSSDREIRFSSKDIDGSVVFADDKVSLIVLMPRVDLSLESAIEIFGEPQSVFVYQGGEYIGVTFFKPQAGIAFSYTSWAQSSTLPWAQAPDWIYSEIRPEAEINFIDYFVPDQYDSLLEDGTLSFGELDPDETLQRLYPWNGYGSIDKYLPPSKP